MVGPYNTDTASPGCRRRRLKGNSGLGGRRVGVLRRAHNRPRVDHNMVYPYKRRRTSVVAHGLKLCLKWPHGLARAVGGGIERILFFGLKSVAPIKWIRVYIYNWREHDIERVRHTIS